MDNMNTLRCNIPKPSLCKTFQDAIQVTRSLGFTYLWIDSLCIIQDSEDDWRQESAMMAEVYGNAIVNLSATSAKDGSVGLFTESAFRAGRQYVRIESTKTPKVYDLVDDNLFKRCMERIPLSSRAWAFQERYLAKRSIHFTAEQIFCECRTHIVCESYPIGIPQTPLTIYEPPFPKTNHPSAWPLVVKYYSTGQLTFPKDKLVALSRVARHFQTTYPDQYCGGMWRNNLERQLCWRTDTEHTDYPMTSRGNNLYRAPSWSWASTDQPITWRQWTTNDVTEITTDQTPLMSFVTVNMSPLGRDPLGQLLDGQLTVKCGPLLQGSLIKSCISTTREAKPGDDTLYENGSPRHNPMDIHVEGKVNYDLDYDDNNIAETRYFLPVLWDFKLGGNYGLEAQYGLVVAPAKGRDKGYFVRIGMWVLSFGVSYEKLMESLSKQPAYLLDESLYQEVLPPTESGLPQYIITLV